jgi:hypothetical protein
LSLTLSRGPEFRQEALSLDDVQLPNAHESSQKSLDYRGIPPRVDHQPYEPALPLDKHLVFLESLLHLLENVRQLVRSLHQVANETSGVSVTYGNLGPFCQLRPELIALADRIKVLGREVGQKFLSVGYVAHSGAKLTQSVSLLGEAPRPMRHVPFGVSQPVQQFGLVHVRKASSRNY